MRLELESIYQTAPVGLAVLDTQLRFLRINDALAAMNGLPVEAHLGRTVGEILPDIAAQAEALLQQVLSTGEPIHDLEIRGETPAQPGVERIWLEQITPLRDDQGRITRLSVVAEEVTQQRRAEEALQRSEANLQLALDAAGLAQWEWRIPTREIEFGENWDRLLGFNPRQRVTTRDSWLSQVHDEDRAAANACIEDHLRGRSESFECEFRGRHADGHWIWISTRGRTVERDEKGRPIRMVGVARDITAQREARQALQEQAQLLQLAFDAIFTWSDEQGIETWNRGAELLYGYTAEEARGVHPNVLLNTVFPCPVEEVKRIRSAEGVWRGELTHSRKDGRLLAVNAVMQDVPGRRERVLEITRDVSEQRRNEARLRERERDLRHSQERLQVALDAGRMGVWDWTPGANDVFWSPEVYKLLGLSPGAWPPEAIHFLQMVHPDDRAKLDAEMARVLTKGGDFESEFRVLRANGETRWLVSRGRVTHDNQGRRSRLVGVNFDITERKLIEEAMREADARRTEFLAMLAHELRNPLAPIVNAVRLLEKVGGDADRRETATQILRRQSAHMARLVDDLMEASRITQGRIELRMENVLLSTSIFQAVEAARPQARDRGQTIDVEVPPALDLVADSVRLTQIVSNLVTNAVKYSPEGGHIEVRAREEGADLLSIAVQDHGPGISAELMPRIFELFTQDKRTLDRSQGGLGIGLALVKRLTELHGGHVRVERPVTGSGARFVVCLPRSGRREEARGHASAPSRATIAPMPMLVVDDNADAAQTLAALLRLDGHRVEVAHDGEQALLAAVALLPRVVLLDLGLPRLDGLAVARRLREEHQFRDTLLIAVSGYNQSTDREASAAAGFDAHLAKPVELADVYRVVGERLSSGA